MADSNDKTECPLCGGRETETIQGGQLRCSNCNLIVSAKTESIEAGATVDTEDQSTGLSLESESTHWQDRVEVRDSSDETLVRLIKETEDRVLELNGTTQDCIEGIELVADAWENHYFRGREISSGIAAVVYTTFRRQESPRPLGVTANACAVSEQELRTARKALKSVLDLNCTLVSPAAYIPFLTSQLDLGATTEETAKEVLDESSGVTGSPTSIASACLYLAAQQQERSITLADASVASGIAKETVWRKTRDIRD